MERKRVAILISGRGSNMASLIEAAKAPAYPAEIVLVVSNKPGAGGLAIAEAEGIPTRTVPHKSFPDRTSFEAEMERDIIAAGVELICLAGFMRILTPDFIRRFEGRMLNIHPSLLPKYPGLHTHQRALDAGDAEAGCTVHEVTPVLDDGPILGQARVPVLPGDTAESLAARVLQQEHRLYPAVLRRFAAGDRTPLFL